MTNKLKFSALVATAALLLREHMQAWLQALSERALSEQVRDLAAAPQRVIPSEDMSIRQVMDRAGASPKGRRSLQAGPALTVVSRRAI
jgi:hypothetical protein